MAIVKNLTVDRYSTYERMFSFLDKNKNPFDLTGYAAKAQIKKYTSESLIAEFDCSVVQPPTLGRIIVTLDYGITANTDPGKYSYDVLLYSNSDTVRAVEGTIDITPNVTEL